MAKVSGKLPSEGGEMKFPGRAMQMILEASRSKDGSMQQVDRMGMEEGTRGALRDRSEGGAMREGLTSWDPIA